LGPPLSSEALLAPPSALADDGDPRAAPGRSAAPPPTSPTPPGREKNRADPGQKNAVQGLAMASNIYLPILCGRCFLSSFLSVRATVRASPVPSVVRGSFVVLGALGVRSLTEGRGGYKIQANKKLYPPIRARAPPSLSHLLISFPPGRGGGRERGARRRVRVCDCDECDCDTGPLGLYY